MENFKLKLLSELSNQELDFFLSKIANNKLKTTEDIFTLPEFKLLRTLISAQMDTVEAASNRGTPVQVSVMHAFGMSFLLGYYIRQMVEQNEKETSPKS